MRYIAAMISIATLLGAAAPAAAEPMTYAEFKTLAQPTGGEKIAYGPAASQFVRLWTPEGAGPHPVAILLHGGCWQHGVASLDYMNAAALDLQKRGVAVWDVEYRSVDEAGGGYPGTFQDVATAVDLLRTEAPKHNLDLKRVVATGHSAGGHLALWAAARPNLPKTSPLYKADPLKIGSVISIAGLPNLQGAPETIALVCGENIVGRLTGPASPAHADVFADTSPLRLLPLNVPVVMVHAAFDEIAPPWHGSDYRKAAKAKGEEAAVVVVPEAGHFELIWPGAQAWGRVADLIETALKP